MRLPGIDGAGMPLIVAGGVFLLVLIPTWGAGWLLSRRRDPDVAGRLKAIAQSKATDVSSPRIGLLRNRVLSAVPFFNQLLTRLPLSNRLQTLLDQAGWKVRPGKVLLTGAVIGLAAFIAATLYIPFLLALPLGIVCGALPLGVVAFKKSRRFRLFQKQFPEAIDLLSRTVRSGQAFTSGMEMVANELADPVASEFRMTVDEQNVGLPQRDALMHLIERIPLSDVRFFVSALLIQRETGGNLGEILDNLGKVMRERYRIQGEVRVRTAQGRLTAGILISLPPILMFLLFNVNHDYAKLLITDPLGRKMLVLAAVLQVIGASILWKIVHIEV
jgi:tight adherence protein B